MLFLLFFHNVAKFFAVIDLHLVHLIVYISKLLLYNVCFRELAFLRLPAGLDLRCIAQLIGLSSEHRVSAEGHVALVKLWNRWLQMSALVLHIIVVHHMITL